MGTSSLLSMDMTLDKSTRIGIGYATHTDAFQCGREAAQTAKRQLPDSPIHLVLIFGPATVHFKDFVEGARLVIGEDCLVAIPTNQTLSNETALKNSCYVVAFQTPRFRISIAADDIAPGEIMRGTNSLVSQFRKHRGNAPREFPHRGCIAFSHQINGSEGQFPHTLAMDLGLETWMFGGATFADTGTGLTCLNKSIHQGIAGIEVLSQVPWGVGSVAIGSFGSHADVVREAVKTALRDAATQMQEAKPCFGLILFEGLLSDNTLFTAGQTFPGVPLIAVSCEKLFVRRPQRSIPQLNDSVLALLVPE